MKSERKQTLESNLLADKIEEFAVQLKRALPAILAITAVVVIGLLAYGLYTSMKETESAKAWTALYFADTDTADLSAISSDFGGTTAALWAKQTAADANMSRALEKVYLDRDLAEQFYKEALSDYRTVADKSSDSFLTGRANFGLAQASEGMGDSSQALSYYRKVISNKSMGAELISEVTKRVAWLESKAGEEFYAWYKTSRASSPVLNANPPKTSPLPSAPNITFPADTTNNAPGSDLAPVPTPPNVDSSKANSPVESTLPSTTTPDATKVDLPKVDDVPAEKKP